MKTTLAESFTIELTAEEAWQLAQLYKRMGFGDFLVHTVDENQDDVYTMIRAFGKVAQALAEKGYAPR